MDSWLIAQLAEISAVNAEIQGMIALNQYRVSRGETPAYDEAAFQGKADHLWGISNYIMRNR